MTTIRRQFETIALSQLIETFFKQPTHQAAAIQATVTNAWHQIMSPTVIAKTHRCFVKNNQLFVCLTSATLRQELQLRKSTILAQLKEKIRDPILVEMIFI
jgi:hypothetical protein